MLSTTWRGIPWYAFGEVVSIGLVIVHAAIGLRSTGVGRAMVKASGRVRIAATGVTMALIVLGCAVVIALATGQR
jgi:hypothetical protein